MTGPIAARRFVLIAILAVGLAACADRPQSGAAMTATRLFFGMSMPGGGTVSEADWRTFLKNEITPRFPDGLTVIAARGQWRNRASGKVVEEPSRMLLLVHKGSARAEAAIDAIVAAYKTRFRQESVMRVDTPARVRF